jgi:thiamine biosynthesis lipoprotein
MNFHVWGLSGTLETEHADAAAYASERLWFWLDAFDTSCNRFRNDSEISILNHRPGDVVPISATLERAIVASLRAGHATNGLCDPTVLPALLALGYDRDYDDVASRTDLVASSPVLPLGLTAIDLDLENHTVKIAPGCQLDLGASAKALVVDVVADELTSHGGIVVELGGDVAVRGSGPDGPWVVGVSDALTITGDEPRISLQHGGIATSSIGTRTWRIGDYIANHIIDPRTGSFTHGTYVTATVTASDCVLANAFATAALLWDEEASYYIAQAGWSARLVRVNGTVEFVGGWSSEGETIP